MSEERVTMTVAEGIADVRLNRPDKLNALDLEQFHAINARIAEIAARDDVNCVVLSGAGRAFSVGIDLTRLGSEQAPNHLMPRHVGDANAVQQAAWGWRTLPVPVIAAVHGYAFGAGCQIMLGADFRITSPQAQISIMEIRWGLVPDVAGMALARGLIRQDHLRELTFTGRRVSGTEAVELGLATRLADDPLATALAMAREIVGNSAEALRAAKRLCNLPPETGTAEVLLAESREQQALLASPGNREAMRKALAGSGSR